VPHHKHYPLSQTPRGHGDGSIFSTKDGKITQALSKEKWDKAKNYLLEFLSKLEEGGLKLSSTIKYTWRRSEIFCIISLYKL
jgi:hypothetical protein